MNTLIKLTYRGVCVYICIYLIIVAVNNAFVAGLCFREFLPAE